MKSPRSAPDRAGRRRVLAGGAALALAASAPALARQQATPSDPGDQTIRVDGVRLNYARLGQGPAVVLIHGASGNLNDMTFRLAPAIAADHAVVAFDRPGHGLSGWPERGGETLRLQASLMRRALAAMGIDRATIIGHSYGGSVALAWALDAPDSVDGLMLLAAPSQVWAGGLGLSNDLLANPLTGPLLARAAPLVVSEAYAAKSADGVFEPQVAPPGYLEHLRLELVLRPAALRANALQLAALKAQIGAMVPRYPTLAMPIEVLHGTADAAVPIGIHSEPFSAQVPAARLTRLGGIGHMIHQVAPQAVLAALARLPRAPLPVP